MIELLPLTALGAGAPAQRLRDGRAGDRPLPEGSPSGGDPNPRTCHAMRLHPTEVRAGRRGGSLRGRCSKAGGARAVSLPGRALLALRAYNFVA